MQIYLYVYRLCGSIAKDFVYHAVVMSLSPDWSENCLIFHITYDSC